MAKSNENAREATKAEKVKVHLFRDNDKYKDDVFVCVNGANVLIQRGKTVEVSPAIAEALENSMQQDALTAELIGKEASESRARMERGGI